MHGTAPIRILVNEKGAADLLGLTARTMQSWRHTGEGPPHVRISSRCVRYRLTDLEQFALDRLATSTGSPVTTGR